MPIKIPNRLPATQILKSENIFVMNEKRASKQDIRPLRIVILNLMPTKIITETQLLRVLSNSPLQIEVDLLRTDTYQSKNTPEEHLESFYRTFSDIKSKKYDGMIITGAPVELLDFEDVQYWDELKEIMEWSKTNVTSTFHICWAAQAALFYHYNIPKYNLPEKCFGVFEHRVKSKSKKQQLMKGFDDRFWIPHSRHTEIHAEDIEKVPELEILSVSEEAGVYLVGTRDGRQIFATGHAEYDRETLASEYFRDKDKGLNIAVPKHYFPNDDPKKKPNMQWRAHANLLFANWLNYYVYQITPYDLDNIQ